MSDAQPPLPGIEGPSGSVGRPGRAARLTARRRALLASGVHPLNNRRLRPEGGTCGTCAHLVGTARSRVYYKCELGHVSRGEATDVRLGWPACVLYEEEA